MYNDFVINSFLHIDNNRIVALGYKGEEAVYQPIGESSQITNTLTSWTVGLPYNRNNLLYGTRYYLKTGKFSQNTRFKWLNSEGNLDLYVKDNSSGYRDIPSDTQVQSILLDVDGKLVVGFKNRSIKRFLGDYQLPVPPLSSYDPTLTPLSRDLFWHWNPREILGSRDLSNSDFSVDVSIPGPDDTFYVCGRRLGVTPYVWWVASFNHNTGILSGGYNFREFDLSYNSTNAPVPRFMVMYKNHYFHIVGSGTNLDSNQTLVSDTCLLYTSPSPRD